MQIHKFVVGPIRTNCYLAVDEQTSDAVLIDPGENAKSILEMINLNKIKVKYVLATHGHYDHVTAVEQILKELQVPFLMHGEDRYLISSGSVPFINMLGYNAVAVKQAGFFKEGDVIKFGRYGLRVIHTPGHTPGSVCLYCRDQGVLFSGDTLFRGDIGRTDLPRGSGESIVSSIANKLITLPENTVVYPGHGPKTTIKEEKNNQYLACPESGGITNEQ